MALFCRIAHMPLRLRMLASADSLPLFNLILQNKDYLQQWFEWAHHVQTQSDIDQFVEQSLKKTIQNRSFDAGIWLEDTLIGMIGFHEINWRSEEHTSEL